MAKPPVQGLDKYVLAFFVIFMTTYFVGMDLLFSRVGLPTRPDSKVGNREFFWDKNDIGSGSRDENVVGSGNRVGKSRLGKSGSQESRNVESGIQPYFSVVFGWCKLCFDFPKRRSQFLLRTPSQFPQLVPLEQVTALISSSLSLTNIQWG